MEMYVGNREVCFWFRFHKESLLLLLIHLQLCVYFCIHVGLFIILSYDDLYDLVSPEYNAKSDMQLVTMASTTIEE